MSLVASHLEGSVVTTILDLGCGTGRFSEALAEGFDAQVVGADPSRRMLERAREKKRLAAVRYCRGTAEAIPLGAESVDMIFMSMSFHHFGDPVLAARECRRVLREDGSVVVRTGTSEQVSSYPYVRFFPKTRSMLDELLPNRATLRGVFEDVGLALVGSEVVTQVIAPSWTAYADKLAAGGDSVLARLTKDEFDTGLAALRSHGADEAGHAIVEPIDLLVFRLPRRATAV
jgi:SAM-dependent methyltransferase